MDFILYRKEDYLSCFLVKNSSHFPLRECVQNQKVEKTINPVCVKKLLPQVILKARPFSRISRQALKSFPASFWKKSKSSKSHVAGVFHTIRL
jgi:hypothetical protein